MSGIFALSFMMVVPVLGAESMPNEGHDDVMDGDSLVVFPRSDDLEVDGSRLELLAFLRLLDRPDPIFPIVTP